MLTVEFTAIMLCIPKIILRHRMNKLSLYTNVLYKAKYNLNVTKQGERTMQRLHLMILDKR